MLLFLHRLNLIDKIKRTGGLGLAQRGTRIAGACPLLAN